ncbi:hypothetical protein [Alkalicoccus chagannorensis]|nr:hypothetical protein [Alkalicoccus chagannorensis]
MKKILFAMFLAFSVGFMDNHEMDIFSAEDQDKYSPLDSPYEA